MSETLSIAYQLPATYATFNGTKTTVNDALAPLADANRTMRSGTVQLDVRADPEARCELNLAESELAQVGYGFKLRDDGRLVGTESAIEAQSELPAKALIKVGAAAATFALAAGAAPITAGVVAAGAVGLAGIAIGGRLAEGSDLFTLLECDADDVTFVDRGPQAPERPTPRELGIHPSFGHDDEQPADFQRLYNYRLALLRLTLSHSQIAMAAADASPSTLDALAGVSAALERVRKEAAHAEAIYEAWCRSKQTVTEENRTWHLRVDQLPTPDEFDRRFSDQFGPGVHEEWWEVARHCGVIVTVDIQDEDAGQATETFPRVEVPEDGSVKVWYRQPVSALVRTWKLKQADRDDDLERELVSSEWMLVTHPRSDRSLDLPVGDASSDRKVSAAFSASGALNELQYSFEGETGRRAEFIAGLPSLVAGSAKSGLELAGVEAAALEKRIAEAEARNKLQGLLNPAPDDLKELREQLEEAKLRSQLAAAEFVRGQPSSAIIVVSD